MAANLRAERDAGMDCDPETRGLQLCVWRTSWRQRPCRPGSVHVAGLHKSELALTLAILFRRECANLAIWREPVSSSIAATDLPRRMPCLRSPLFQFFAFCKLILQAVYRAEAEPGLAPAISLTKPIDPSTE